VVAPELVIQTARAGEVVDCGDGDGHGAVDAAPLRACGERRDEQRRIGERVLDEANSA
jgi:hypothetical protein